MIRGLIARIADWASPALADMGLPEQPPTVRECHADDLAVLTDEDLFALRSHVAWASHPHEATAAERIGGAA